MNWVTNSFARLMGRVPQVTTQAFEVGKRGRRLAAIPANSLALNTLILQYGATSIARSRYLCINNPYTVSAKEVFISAMVGGAGIRPSTLDEDEAVKTEVHADWDNWCQGADADGITNLAGLEAEAASEWFETGEAFLTFITPQNAGALADDDEVPLKLRIIPTEMLPYDNQSTTPVGAVGNYIQMGIEFNPAGERVAYHFLTTNPTDISRTDYREFKRVRIPSEDVIHLFRPLRAGQVRGIPFTLSALITSAMLDLYDDAELERKRTAALFAAFITKQTVDGDSPMGQALPNAGSMAPGLGNAPPAWKLEPGSVIELLPGEDVSFAAPADVGASYEPFEYRALTRMAAGFGVPYAAMTGDLRAANYGSIRAGLIQFKRRIESMQFQNFIPQAMRRVWLRWLKDYTFWGLSPWPTTDWVDNAKRRQHQKVKWLTPRWEWVDPLKDMQAEKLAIDNGFQSRLDTVEEMGNDPSENDARILEAQQSEDEFERPLNTGQDALAVDPETGVKGGTPPKFTKEKPDAA